MARIRSLSAPPIQEALIDFVIASQPLAEEQLRKLADDARADSSWQLDELKLIEAKLDIADLKSLTSSHTVEGVRAKNADDSVVIAFRPTRVTVSHIRSYDCWEDLQAVALQSLQAFIRMSGDASVTRVATRFINLLKPGESFADTLVVPPVSPVEGGELMEFADHRVVTLKDGITVHIRQATATHRLTEEAPPEKAIMVDVDAFCDCSIDAADPQLGELLARLREAKNRVFFGAVTESALEAYQ